MQPDALARRCPRRRLAVAVVCAAVLGTVAYPAAGASALPADQPSATQVVSGVVGTSVGVSIEVDGTVHPSSTTPVEVYRGRRGDTVVVTVVPA
ncbi:MAG: hypothetical protein E6G56_03645 [Actinobacteria bacterium]|nr:MAG: hypothetical protein E6G56_03645 [Actinomycetota bacterium]